jgi:hypothetical protein
MEHGVRNQKTEGRGQNFGFRIADLKKAEKRGSAVGAAFSRDLAVSTNFLIF